MGSIKILDTGYVKPTNTGTQASAGNMANSGSAISLQTAEFTPNQSRNMSNQPDLSSNTPAEVNLGSVENLKFSLTIKFDTKVAADMTAFVDVLALVGTDGYKLIWYDYSNGTTEKKTHQLVWQLAQDAKFGHALDDAEKTAFSISDNFSHLHVHFSEFQPKQIGKSGHFTATLKGIVLKVEENELT